ncbi:RNA polymerase sigma factor [Aureitalea marina]|uniref:RNA polymerase subunit sigma-24 n=1 Tax=Aureitalea marina TaxID=930804 RepID=A0A2S7KQ49_9FLAO|nr:RNA polymerase sigma factor [Aureitalea marina]PQB04752.1 RNA polymerase subunit sigma-24 [Aureitalea marina]
MPVNSTIIQRFLEGDQQALSHLYDQYSGAIYGVLLRMCRQEDIAQDVLQETFITIWEKRNSYNPEKGQFYTWAYRIGRNKMLNFLRNSPDLIQKEDLSVYDNKGASEEQPLDREALNGAIAKLEPHHKQALDLVYFSGMTHREAHQEMNVALGTFKSYIRQALKKLRENYQVVTALLMMMIDKML